MLTRFLLIALLIMLVFRAIGRVVRGVAEGAMGTPPPPRPNRRGGQASPPATRGEAMARDPVCGTYVVPTRAVSARGTDGPVYFCSDACRQAYKVR